MAPGNRALGALGSNCGNRRFFHSAAKTLRLKIRRVNTKQSRKSFVKLERLKGLFHPAFSAICERFPVALKARQKGPMRFLIVRASFLAATPALAQQRAVGAEHVVI